MGYAAAILCAFGLVLAPVASAQTAPGVQPRNVDRSIPPGESETLTKTVNLPVKGAAPVDVYMLADSTGSMGGAIAKWRDGAGDIIDKVNDIADDPRFGAGDYKDFPSDSYAFLDAAPIPETDDDGAAALEAIDAWSAAGGGDTPEGQLYALHRIANDDNSFRPAASPIVVWFGDAPGHDPVCKQISGEAVNITEKSVTDDLVAAGIKVLAVSVTSGVPDALDGDPTNGAFNYDPPCKIRGAAGQATRIADATGGTHFKDVDPEDVVDKIIEGIENRLVTAKPRVEETCDGRADDEVDDAAIVEFDKVQDSATGGTSVEFKETISVDADASLGDVITCEVDFLIDGQPAGDDFKQTIRITANTPPTSVVTCDPEEGAPPLTVSFDGSESSDPDEEDEIIEYVWDFGDGSDPVNGPDETALEHTYSEAGEYTVTLTVYDTYEAAGTATCTVLVAEPVVPDTAAPTTTDGGTTAAATDTDGDLPFTGANSVFKLLAAALITLGLGLVLFGLTRQRRDRVA